MSSSLRDILWRWQVSVQVCVFIFDLLMADGEVLLKESLRQRRARIPQALPSLRPGFIQMAQSFEFASPDVGLLPPQRQVSLAASHL